MTRGRPRQFDVGQALQSAMELFWRQGYESTSCEQLLKAMGINSGSMYATFGDKGSLYEHALERYTEAMFERVCTALDAHESPLESVVAFLRGVEGVATKRDCKGCFVTNTLIEFGDDDPNGFAARARKLTERVQKRFAERFRQAQEAGELGADADPDALAAFVVCSMGGLSVMGRTGAGKATIRGAVDTIIGALR